MRPGTAPPFWWAPAGWQARLLAPAAALYSLVAARPLRREAPSRAAVPVLCVGNFTAGGGGKTPTAIALGEAARRLGRRPGFLSRGHGGSVSGALAVDPRSADATIVGDEPLLLARHAPTAVAVDRAMGARLLAEAGCDFVVMDDGFQSRRLHPDLALLVVDGRRGLGNGRVIPAGPLRAPLALQLERADAVLVVGEGEAGERAAFLARKAGLPVHNASIRAVNAERFRGVRVLAFAAIADPAKFYRSLDAAGAVLGLCRDFADHHPFTTREIEEVERAADRAGLVPVTTAKDAVRLEASAAGRRLLQRSMVLEIELELEPGQAEELVLAAVRAFERA